MKYMEDMVEQYKSYLWSEYEMKQIENEKTNTELLSLYEKKKEEYFVDLFELNTLFEVTKDCGYSIWIPVSANASLNMLYITIAKYFNCTHENIKLYVQIQDKDKNEHSLIIPWKYNFTVKDFIIENKQYFTAIYPLPAKVVYKIYIKI